MNPQNLLVELLVEELPPKALHKLGRAFADGLARGLQALDLCGADARITPYASPRRLAVHISGVLARAPDRPLRQKLMPVRVGLGDDGQPTPALLKKLAALGVPTEPLSELERAQDGKAESLFLNSMAAGATLADGLQQALDDTLGKLPIPKVMSYQLHQGTALPGWDSVQFVRPVHGLVALHGADGVPVSALGLQAGRNTQGHRFEASHNPVQLRDADSYAEQLEREGGVIASFEQRRSAIAEQLQAVAAQAGAALHPIEDAELLDEVTALVERPNVLLCQFEPDFLEVPQECLILTMKANQKYFPLLDAQGKLTHHFLVVSNISPTDPSAVIEGNERVVRPRLADAKFFYDQDRRQPLAARLPQLDQVVYHNQLGSQGERSQRVQAIARLIGEQLGDAALADQAVQAARLAKADLLTDMVGEFPELQGVMGGYYARHDGLPEAIALAVEDHYKPRFAGDTLPRGPVGTVVALADKLETLVGLFGIGQLPTGERDPFALRRHALGVIRMVAEQALTLDMPALIDAAAGVFGPLLPDASASNAQLLTFIRERMAGYLREQGASSLEAEAVIAAPLRWSQLRPALQAVQAFGQMSEAPALAAANKRIGNILKKAEADAPVAAQVRTELLHEPAERQLHERLQQLLPQADTAFEAGDYSASLRTLAALRDPVDAFFDDVMVNAEDAALRANRLGLLKQLHQAMNRVADLSRLAA